MPRTPARRRDLRAELLSIAIADARVEGRRGVVLRRVARRAGVSPTAAYRHFGGYADLLDAVAEATQGRLQAVLREQIRLAAADARDGTEAAFLRLRGAGRGYVLFAVREPGWFDCACAEPPAIGSEDSPLRLLSETLDGCVAAGLLDPGDRDGAEILAWLGVHGLASQVQLGILPAEDPEFSLLLERTLDFVGRGLGVRRPPPRPPGGA